jgi:hypothetical protein
MYIAQVVSSELVDGLLKVIVSITNGIITVSREFNTRSSQDENWLKRMTKREVDDLNSLEKFAPTIIIGAIDLTEFTDVEPISEDILTPRGIYQSKLRELEGYISAIRKGVISDTNTDFIACKTWLTDFFDSSYIDLF